LGLEHIRVLETEAHAAQAEERIRFLRQRQAIERLVAADIQRANDDILRKQLARELAVVFELLLLVGQVIAVKKEYFRAVKADALRVTQFVQREIVGPRQVGGERNVMTVARGRGGFPQLAQVLLDALALAREFLIFAKRFGPRIDHHQPAE